MNIQSNWKEIAYEFAIENQLPKECLSLIHIIDSLVSSNIPFKRNSIQSAILLLLDFNKGEFPLHLRGIARKIGEKYPEKIKYHLKKLEDSGEIKILNNEKIIKKIIK